MHGFIKISDKYKSVFQKNVPYNTNKHSQISNSQHDRASKFNGKLPNLLLDSVKMAQSMPLPSDHSQLSTLYLDNNNNKHIEMLRLDSFDTTPNNDSYPKSLYFLQNTPKLSQIDKIYMKNGLNEKSHELIFSTQVAQDDDSPTKNIKSLNTSPREIFKKSFEPFQIKNESENWQSPKNFYSFSRKLQNAKSVDIFDSRNGAFTDLQRSKKSKKLHLNNRENIFEHKRISEALGFLISGKINTDETPHKRIITDKNKLYSPRFTETFEAKKSCLIKAPNDYKRNCLDYDISPAHGKPIPSIIWKDKELKKSKDQLLENKVYRMDTSHDYSIKITEEIGKDLINIQSIRNEWDENKMIKLLEMREKYKARYLEYDEVENLSSMKKIPRVKSYNSLINYRDQKMPFSLAVLAKIRKSIVSEIKTINGHPKIAESKKKHDQAKKMMELREKILPEEEAKYIHDINKEQNKKRLNDIKWKGSASNPFYSILALDNESKKRITKKLGEILPQNSRFHNMS